MSILCVYYEYTVCILLVYCVYTMSILCVYYEYNFVLYVYCNTHYTCMSHTMSLNIIHTICPIL